MQNIKMKIIKYSSDFFLWKIAVMLMYFLCFQEMNMFFNFLLKKKN